MNPSITINESLKAGWALFKKSTTFWVMACLIFIAFLLGIMAIASSIAPNNMAIRGIINLCGMLIRMWIHLGMVGAALLALRGAEPQIKDLFAYGHSLIKMILGSIIYAIPVMGLAALGIGAFILFPHYPMVTIPFSIVMFCLEAFIAVRLIFYPFFIVDKNCDSMESLRLSWHATQKHFWFLCLFFFVMGLINLLGVIAIGLGLFITIPVTILATTYVYLRLA